MSSQSELSIFSNRPTNLVFLATVACNFPDVVSSWYNHLKHGFYLYRHNHYYNHYYYNLNHYTQPNNNHSCPVSLCTALLFRTAQ